MAALDFPASPAVNDRYPLPAVAGQPQYKWDGEKWTTASIDTTVAPPATALPLMDAATAAVGVTTKYAREDHVHPKIPAAGLEALAYSGMQINGSMEISQEKGITPSTAIGYVCDGWKIDKIGTMVLNSAVTVSNYFPGLPNVLWTQPTTAQTSLGAGDFAFFVQRIEGYRVSRLGFGRAAPQPITIGFWTMHHRVGTYTVVVSNQAFNRTYATTYTQNVADIPEYKTITVPGCSDGVWPADNTQGLQIIFTMAAGTTYTAPSANTWHAAGYMAAPGQVNGVAATSDAFRIGGVVVLPGIEAPSAERSPLIMRPYDQELLTCQRYYYKNTASMYGYLSGAGLILGEWFEHPVTMRASPTVLISGGTLNTGTADPITAGTPNGFIKQITGTAAANIYHQYFTISADARL